MNPKAVLFILLLLASTLLSSAVFSAKKSGLAKCDGLAETLKPSNAVALSSVALRVLTADIGDNDTVILSNGYYVLNETLTVRENATLTIENAELIFNTSSSTILQAYDNSSVTIINSTLSHVSGYCYAYSYGNATVRLNGARMLGYFYFYLYGKSAVTLINSNVYSLTTYGSSKVTLGGSLVSYLYEYDSANVLMQDSITERFTLGFYGNSTLSAVLPRGYVDYWNLYAGDVTTDNLNVTLVRSTANVWSVYASDTAALLIRDSTLEGATASGNSTVRLTNCTVNYAYAYYASAVTLLDSAVTGRVSLEFYYGSNVSLFVPTGHVDKWNLYTDSLIDIAYLNVTLKNVNVTGWSFSAYNSTVSILNSSIDSLNSYDNCTFTVENSTCYSVNSYAYSSTSVISSTVNYAYLYEQSSMSAQGSVLGTVNALGNSSIMIDRCRVDYVTENDYASALIEDSTVYYRIQLSFVSNSIVSLNSLPIGTVSYWNIFGNSTTVTAYVNLTLVNSKIRGWGTMYLSGDSQFSISDSVFDGAYCSGHSAFAVTNSFVDSVNAQDYSNITITDSAVSSLVFAFRGDSDVSLTSLVPGAIDYWNLFANSTVGKAYVNHTISNSQIGEWSVYAYDTATVSVMESVLDSFYCYGDSAGSLNNCTTYSSGGYGKSVVSLTATSVQYFEAYDESTSVITSSEIARLRMQFQKQSKASVRSLTPGSIDFWNLYQNATVSGAGFNLTIFGSKVKAWACSVYGFSVVSFTNSIFDNLQAGDFSNVRLFNCTVEYLYAYRLSKVWVEDYSLARSTVSYLYTYESSAVFITRSDVAILSARYDSYVELTGSICVVTRVYDRARVQVQWFLEVRVTDRNAQNISSANVTVRDQSGTKTYSGLTGSNGSATFLLVGKTVDASDTHLVGNYNVTATYAGQSETRAVEMNESKELTISLMYVIPEFLPTLITLALIALTLFAVALQKRSTARSQHFREKY